MLTPGDRKHCERLLAQGERSWFERRGLDYVGWGLTALIAFLGLRGLPADSRESALYLAAAGFMSGAQIGQVLLRRDRRILLALYRAQAPGSAPGA
jgi:hypothetical protein